MDKIHLVYEKMDGWIGFGKDGKGEDGIPYWFSYNENDKSIYASFEPSGLLFIANIESKEWIDWKLKFKHIATEILEFKVGEIEEGEVSHEIEWVTKKISKIENKKTLMIK